MVLGTQSPVCFSLWVVVPACTAAVRAFAIAFFVDMKAVLLQGLEIDDVGVHLKSRGNFGKNYGTQHRIALGR